VSSKIARVQDSRRVSWGELYADAGKGDDIVVVTNRIRNEDVASTFLTGPLTAQSRKGIVLEARVRAHVCDRDPEHACKPG